MVDCYVGEIRLFAGTRAPENWLLCDGGLVSISDNPTLFALLGTLYGGDGVTTFGVPDLRGRVPIGQGQGPGLTQRVIAQAGGVEAVTLLEANLPAHTHLIQTSGGAATTATPGSTVTLASTSSSYAQYHSGTVASAQQQELSVQCINSNGAGLAHENVMPSMAVTYIIAKYGVFPSRS